ncbi:MAG: hypothetical protein JWL77_1496 [Chthonomonadaceae bacterium]|nr:hypothetical protein [Chthonomonadaceae bacterium]
MSIVNDPEREESAPKSGGSERRSGRPRRKHLAILVAVLVMGAGVAWGLSAMRQKRKEFVGRVDPTSGLRCRFTLAADWVREDRLASWGQSSGHLPQGLLDIDRFSAPPPGPIHKWITTHLFPSSASQRVVPAINFTSLQAGTGLPYYQIQSGYPEPSSVPRGSLTYTHRHLQIDGCPATMITASNKKYSGSAVMVYVPNRSIAYIVSGYAAPEDMALINHEMQEVVSSFHIQNVAAPSGGKGGGK